MTLQTMSFIFGALLLAVAILGGGFEIKELKVSNVTKTARAFAGIAGIVFVVLGFWQPSGLTGSTPATVAAEMGPREPDKDRWGGDYSSFAINTGYIERCESACKTDTKCAAWTYVNPGIQGPQARCYLKNVIPAISDNDCCVSGTKIGR